MSNPWDVPPLPTIADEDIDAVYSGVGRVTSEWEGIEVNLSRIYSFFLEDPDGYETMRKYGEGRIFKERFKELQCANDRFFLKRHDQQIEGEFHHLAIKAAGFADRRNDVAHGIVNPIQFYKWFQDRATGPKPRTNYWALIPPYYKFRKHLDDGMPSYVYTSIELRSLEKSLSALYGELSEYREKLRMLLANRG